MCGIVEREKIRWIGFGIFFVFRSSLYFKDVLEWNCEE